MIHSRFGALVLGISVGLCAAPAGLSVSMPAPKDRERTTPFVQWAVSRDFDANEPHDPLVVKGMVIVGTDQGHLRAYRCKDGLEHAARQARNYAHVRISTKPLTTATGRAFVGSRLPGEATLDR
jgi:hypothetical protein